MRPSQAQGGGGEERVARKLPRDLYLPSPYPEQLLATLRMCSSSLPHHIHLLQLLIRLHRRSVGGVWCSVLLSHNCVILASWLSCSIHRCNTKPLFKLTPPAFSSVEHMKGYCYDTPAWMSFYPPFPSWLDHAQTARNVSCVSCPHTFHTHILPWWCGDKLAPALPRQK